MNYTRRTLLIACLLTSGMIGCDNLNKESVPPPLPNVQQNEIEVRPKSEIIKTIEQRSETNSTDEVSSMDGVYSYIDNSAEIEIIVSGDTWTGKTKIISGFGEAYDESNTEYESGIVKGNQLYESSGFVKIGSIDGRSITTSIGGNIINLRKK
jgi:hypothetical protein